MKRCKKFGGPYSAGQQEMDEWFEANPNIEIISIHTSIESPRKNETITLVYIFYKIY